MDESCNKILRLRSQTGKIETEFSVDYDSSDVYLALDVSMEDKSFQPLYNFSCKSKGSRL